jgi:DUF1707 SHOCT-like domain
MANTAGRASIPELRVSDAERDVIVSELGQHFQDGRLSQEEFDQRVGAALAARTRGDLGQLMTDLPRPSVDSLGPPHPGPASRRRAPALALVPLMIAVVVAAGAFGGWHHHPPLGWPLAPFGFLWLIIPVLAARFWLIGGRRRQWR